MKKFVILLLILLFWVLTCFIYNKYSIDKNKSAIETQDSITFDEYLQINKNYKNQKYLNLNANGNVMYKSRVILTNKGVPLNENSAYTDNELKVLFEAKGIKPRKNCNPNDASKNGSLGCYIDNPDK